MADPTDKIKPKFSSSQDATFWEQVYIANIRALSTGMNACSAADRALERRQERMTDSVREMEDPLSEE